MIHKVLSDARFFEILQQFDEDIAAEVKARRCPVCGERLDRANYPRKPRGELVTLGPGYDQRLSFCCCREGCRKRMTPPSVRFLGRKVYLGAVVVLASAMLHGVNSWRLSKLQKLLGVSLRTLKRWRRWWADVFGPSCFFKTGKAVFGEAVQVGSLPLSLLEFFGWPDNAQETLAKVLKLLRPITSPPHLHATFF